MKFNFLLLFFSSSVLVFICGDYNRNCNGKLLRCYGPLRPQDIAMVPLDMKPLCSLRNHVMSCLHDYPECQTSTGGRGTDYIPTGFQKLFSIFCSDEDSEIKKVYLANEKCLRDNTPYENYVCQNKVSVQDDRWYPDPIHGNRRLYQWYLVCMKKELVKDCGTTAASVRMKVHSEVMCALKKTQEAFYCHDPTCFVDAIYSANFTDCKQQLERCTNTNFDSIPELLYPDIKATCRNKDDTLRCIEESPKCRVMDSPGGVSLLKRGFEEFSKVFCNDDLTLKEEYMELYHCLQPFDSVMECLSPSNARPYAGSVPEDADVFNHCLVDKVIKTCGPKTGNMAYEKYLQISCAFSESN